MSRPKRENDQCENEWWRMVGSGVRWEQTWSTKVLTFFFFFNWWDVTEGINAKDKFGLTLQKALPLVAIPVVVAKVEQFMDLFPCYTMLLVMLQVVIRQFAIAELSVNFWVNLM